MKEQRDERKQRPSLKGSPGAGAGGLLKTGVFSLLLHIALILFLVLNLKAGNTNGGSSIYRVTLQPLSSQDNFRRDPLGALSSYLPILEKNQIQKEEGKSMEEMKQGDPVRPPEQLPQHLQEEETVKKPIPLPIGEESTLSADKNLKKEDNLPTILASAPLREQSSQTISDVISWDGMGGSGWGSFGEGLGMGQGGSGTGGSGGGLKVGEGETQGKGIGSGPGTGSGGFGWGGSGIGGGGAPYPKYAQNPKPDYPQEAREKGYQGEVLLRVEVLWNGRVGQIEVKRSCGYDMLDQSALSTVRQWIFTPARKKGVPVPCWVTIPIRFRLL